MADRAGTVLHHVRLVQSVARVACLALLVDRLKSDAVMESIAYDLLELRRRERSPGYQ